MNSLQTFYALLYPIKQPSFVRILNIGGDFLISITQLIGGTRPPFPGVDTNNHNFVSIVLSDLLYSVVSSRSTVASLIIFTVLSIDLP